MKPLIGLLFTCALLTACTTDEPAADPTSSPVAPSTTEDNTPAATATAPATSTEGPSPGPTAAATSAPAPTATPPVQNEPNDGPGEATNDAEPDGADLLQLQGDMARAIDEYWVAGNYAVAVTDLQTGETVSVRGDVRQMSGCSMNLFVLYQVAFDVQEGRYALSRVDDLVRATTWSSNAVTAQQLYGVVGGGDTAEGVRRVAESIDELGLEDVLLDHPPGFHEFSLGKDYNNWVTAESMNRALAALWLGDVVGGEMRRYLLDRLAEVKPGLNYLTAYVPEGIVSHKNGFFLGDTGYVDNDVGIVRLQRGDQEYAYAISFLAEEVPSEYGDVVLGQQLGRMAYDVMAARYPPDVD